VLSVVTEHFEDVAIERAEGWIFIQIKTRDPGLGPWRLADVLPPGKGLPSLLRAHQAVPGIPARYELHLEGHVKRDDLIAELLQPHGTRSDDLQRKAAEKLEITEAECAVFLDRLCVREMPARELVRQFNLGLIGEIGPNLTAGTIDFIQEDLVEEISRAMEMDGLGEGWPIHVTDPTRTQNDLAARVNAKRLTPERLERFRVHLEPQSGHHLLSGASLASGHQPSDLVRKLLEGGADQGLIELAVNLRSNAVRAEVEFMSRDLLGNDAKLEDMKTRLLLAAAPLPGLRRGEDNCAAKVFQDLKTEIAANAASIDPHWVFGRDTAFLMGEVCELSDQCKLGWS
jgi:hypothetical protein